MKKILKRIHLFPFMIYLVVISLLLGILYRYSLSKENVIILYDNIHQFIVTKSSFMTCFFEPLLYSFLLFILGISIIGFPFIILLLCIYSFLFSFEFASFLTCFHIRYIFQIIFFFIPRFIRIFSYFIVSYYSISYSICLVKVLFFNDHVSLFSIMKKYLKIFFLFLLFILLSSLIEFFIIPRFSTIFL